MHIFINENPAEITLDTEKTLGEVISGIENWISKTGNRIQRILTDGKEVSGEDLSQAFETPLDSVEKLEIFVSSFRELATEALEILHQTCVAYTQSSFEERSGIFTFWGESSSARFLNTDIPDIYHLATLSLSGNGLSAADLTLIIEERLREFRDPLQEILKSESQVNAISARMEELPLDLQTGKDQRAAETIQLFSQMGEKLFRILLIFKSEGLSPETVLVDEIPVKTFVEDFSKSLVELIKAYENNDTVLAGDISEYELAPAIVKFFTSLKNLSNLHSTVHLKP